MEIKTKEKRDYLSPSAHSKNSNGLQLSTLFLCAEKLVKGTRKRHKKAKEKHIF